MLNSISENNLSLIKEALREHNYTHILIIDYASNVNTLLEFIADNISSNAKIKCLSEKNPSEQIDKIEIQEETISNWSLRDYITFFFGKSHASFKNHQPIYKKDVSRLHLWRRNYLKRFWKKRLIGSIRGQFRGHDIDLIFDSGPEKDHYGESPLIVRKIQFVENFICESKSSPRRVGCFISVGPRHQYIQTIIKNSKNAEFISIFSAGLFRTSAYETIKSFGKFYKGTNTSVYGKLVYSDHCLKIGAGKRELWVMNIRKGREV